MSKDSSGLFNGTSGSKSTKSLPSKSELKNRISEKQETLIEKTPGGKGKSLIIGAFDETTGKTSVAFAGEPPKKIHPVLQKLADEMGGIGSLGVSDKNKLGVCAEFHVVNSLLWSGSKLENIKFTTPTRPRNGEAIDFCPNCVKMFKEQIGK
ncbi:MAG: hypothetical protein HUK25_02580 [Treponema sp.]|nr:hypothetical protein [Treponema sp.]